MQNIIAKVLSYILHPLLMPTYGTIILFNTNAAFPEIPFGVQKVFYLIVFLMTFILPVLLISIGVQLKIVRNLNMENSRDRIVPLLLATIAFSSCYYLIGQLPWDLPYTIEMFVSILRFFLLASIIAVVLNLLVTIKWKISSHMIGIGGLVAATIITSTRLTVDLQAVIFIAVFLAGLLGYARLQLGAHNPAQVYAGFLFGFSTVFLMVSMMHII